MCLDDRNTDSRVRPRATSLILRRTVAVRRAVRSLNLDITGPLLLLSFLAEDILVRISHALALVGFGWAVTADLGGDVADLRLIDAGHHNLGRFWRRHRNAFGDREVYVVGKPELQLQRLALYGGAKTDTGNLQLLFEAFGHARHQVGDQRP